MCALRLDGSQTGLSWRNFFWVFQASSFPLTFIRAETVKSRDSRFKSELQALRSEAEVELLW